MLIENLLRVEREIGRDEGYREALLDRFDGPSAHDVACRFLRDALADGPRYIADLSDAATAGGISGRTLYRASKALGVSKRPEGSRGHWLWQLPEPMLAKVAKHTHEEAGPQRPL